MAKRSCSNNGVAECKPLQGKMIVHAGKMQIKRVLAFGTKIHLRVTHTSFKSVES